MNETKGALSRILAPSLTEFRKQFEPYLERFLAAKQQTLAQYENDPFVADLLDYPNRLLLAGGKRVRPFMAYLMYAGGGEAPHSALYELLVSIELFHTFCLVHDDVMDNGDERHGLPTTHRYVQRQLRRRRRRGDLARVGQSQAVLVGDLLFLWSQEPWDTVAFRPHQRLAAWRHFQQMIMEVIIGQMIDVDTTTRHHVSDALIATKTYLKTASYSFIQPLRIGLALTGTDQRLDSFCQEFGRAVGLAFQMQDDLFDVTANSASLRKPVFNDLAEHQHTYFTQYVLTHGSLAERQQLKAVFGTRVPARRRAAIKQIFISSGALASGQQKISAYFDQAERVLAESGLSHQAQGGFNELLAVLRARRS